MRKIVVATVVACLLLAACTSGSEPKPQAASSPTPVLEQEDRSQDGAPAEEEPEETGPGREVGIQGLSGPQKWHTYDFEPQLVFETPADPTPLFMEQIDRDFIFFGGTGGALIFVRPERVYDPTGGKLVPVPNDLAGWLTSHPWFEVLEGPTETRLGGKRATELELMTVSNAKPTPDGCDGPCLPVTDVGEGLGYVKGIRVGIVVIDRLSDGKPFLVSVDSSPKDYRPFRAEVDRILKTLKFRAG